MKRVIRGCVWETNSSMTHSCVIMSAEQYERWKKDDLYCYKASKWWNPFKDLPEEQQPKNGMIYTEDEAVDFLKLIGEKYDEEDYYHISQFLSEYSFYSYGCFTDDEYCEFDATDYTTPNGEELVIICKYGHDG